MKCKAEAGKSKQAEAYVELFRKTHDKVAAAVNAALDRFNETAYNRLNRLESTRYQSGSSRTLHEMRKSFNSWISEHLAWMKS